MMRTSLQLIQPYLRDKKSNHKQAISSGLLAQFSGMIMKNQISKGATKRKTRKVLLPSREGTS
jgi:hypothetical protein